MTTLPPEGTDGQETGGQPTSDSPTGAPQAPTTPPAAPAPPTGAPQQPQYQAPPQQPQQPQYQAPPQAGYQQPVADPVSNITLNYWLSVFFTWIPALIFFLIEKDKGNQQAYAFHRDNLNFSLLRVGVMIATYILMIIPYIGWVLGILLWIGSLVLFVFHIIAAVKAPDGYRRGGRPEFIFNIPLVK